MPFSRDLSGRARVGSLTTLADLKTVNADLTQLIQNVGTGAFTFSGNMTKMAVTAGQYCIRRSKQYYPYFSGKSQLIEMTQSKFEPEAGLIKRFGYFSSNAVAPYDSGFDGFFVQSDTDDGVTFQVWRAGERIHFAKQANWSEDPVLGMNWNAFVFCAIDFLWLGGLGVRLFFKYGSKVVFAHQFSFNGDDGLIIKSPNQTIRYEIRSTVGNGYMNAICVQVSTEGSTAESGRSASISTGTSYIACASIGTTYALLGVRKKSGFRDSPVRPVDFGALVASTNDQVLLSLKRNPTFSGGSPVYSDVANVASIQSAVGNGAITVTGSEGDLYSIPLATTNILSSQLLDEDFLTWLGSLIDDTSDTIWLCARPLSANVNIAGTMILRAY